MSSATEPRVALPARYRIVRHIANGGMASVWAVEDELLSRLVAVKVLARAYSEDKRAFRRFHREARAGAKLSDCRHVVTVYDVGEHDGRPFMVMEHLSGGTIADRLRAAEPIPRALALRWLREAAEALDCAHRHGLVHRDVKPANLLLDEQGRLAVGDFGIATVASEASLTQTGQVLGTAAYISPEQARGEPATAASDRYALAAVAYELLAGRRPFSAEYPAAQARAHAEATVPLVNATVGDLPRAVDEVLRAGLGKEPGARPATAARFVDLLEEAVGDESEPLRAQTVVAAAPTPRAVARAPLPPRHVRVARVRSGRRRLPIVLALAALAIAAAAVLAIAAIGGDRERRAAPGSPASASTPKRGPAETRPAQTQQAPASSQPRSSEPAEDPVALNDQGKALIDNGRPVDAIAPLERSVAAYRQRERTGELGYAFALYNLGNSLRLAGRPADAIPLLQERLRVSSNQRRAVEQELALAQEQAGLGTTSDRKRDKAKGKRQRQEDE